MLIVSTVKPAINTEMLTVSTVKSAISTDGPSVSNERQGVRGRMLFVAFLPRPYGLPSGMMCGIKYETVTLSMTSDGLFSIALFLLDFNTFKVYPYH